MKTGVFWSNAHLQMCVYKWVDGIGWHILHVGTPKPVAPRNPFHTAAVNVRTRFYRRFPQVSPERYDLTTIKSRWYERGHSAFARTRFA